MNELVEFERYTEHLCAGLGHSDRHAGLRGYCTGLMAPLKRKSVEPMASHLARPVRARGINHCTTSWLVRNGPLRSIRSRRSSSPTGS